MADSAPRSLWVWPRPAQGGPVHDWGVRCSHHPVTIALQWTPSLEANLSKMLHVVLFLPALLPRLLPIPRAAARAVKCKQRKRRCKERGCRNGLSFHGNPERAHRTEISSADQEPFPKGDGVTHIRRREQGNLHSIARSRSGVLVGAGCPPRAEGQRQRLWRKAMRIVAVTGVEEYPKGEMLPKSNKKMQF